MNEEDKFINDRRNWHFRRRVYHGILQDNSKFAEIFPATVEDLKKISDEEFKLMCEKAFLYDDILTIEKYGGKYDSKDPLKMLDIICRTKITRERFYETSDFTHRLNLELKKFALERAKQDFLLFETKSKEGNTYAKEYLKEREKELVRVQEEYEQAKNKCT